MCQLVIIDSQLHAPPSLLSLRHSGLEAYKLHFIDSLASYLPERIYQLGEERKESNAIFFLNFLLSAVHPAVMVAAASFRSVSAGFQLYQQRGVLLGAPE